MTLALLVGFIPLVFAWPSLGDERKQGILPPEAGAPDASSSDAGARARDAQADASFIFSKDAPDPEPLVTQDKWLFDLRYQKGDVYLLGTHPIVRTTKTPTPRAFGRFALELYEGAALLERVRFDFPLLGAESPKDSPDLTSKLTSRIGVLFPKTDRGTRLELVDRATQKRFPLPWPPATPTPTATDSVQDAGK